MKKLNSPRVNKLIGNKINFNKGRTKGKIKVNATTTFVKPIKPEVIDTAGFK